MSPFSIADDADPILQEYVNCGLTNAQEKADIRKNLSDICDKSNCDYFVLDNTSAIVKLCCINGRLYSTNDRFYTIKGEDNWGRYDFVPFVFFKCSAP